MRMITYAWEVEGDYDGTRWREFFIPVQHITMVGYSESVTTIAYVGCSEPITFRMSAPHAKKFLVQLHRWMSDEGAPPRVLDVMQLHQRIVHAHEDAPEPYPEETMP